LIDIPDTARKPAKDDDEEEDAKPKKRSRKKKAFVVLLNHEIATELITGRW
jgi:hypothetical protein